ncbi:diacylglycerol/lipid kinase family protein [uncultured Jatrophihabitans sp.]|uniref:diacylglycerol/lipid kinase family protein n=1 Tax=uncultured Jatrophihabitans sp. TaxID=1610747 RepID=UPI0035CAA973
MATVQIHQASSPEGSRELIAGVAASCDAVVVLGGDGIVHLAAQSLAQTSVPLGIVAAGTGNDVVDTLGLAADPLAGADAIVAALDAGTSRRLDLGRTEDGRWWVTVLCAGFDSAVTERANALRWPKGPRRYDVAIAAELVRLAPRPFRLELDGEVLDEPAMLVAIGNGPQYGGGKRICEGARMDDGTFLVTVVRPVGRLTFARIAPKMATAGHLGHRAVTQHVARRVTVFAPDTPGYADGERLGPLPLTTECVPGALRVLVPPR